MTSRPRRILIVGLNYTPEHTGNAPYTAGMAEYLATTGCDVTVITAMPHYPAWRIAPEYSGRRSARESVNGVTLVRRAGYVPARQSAIRRMAYDASFVLAAFPVTNIPRPDIVIGIVPGLSGGVLARLFAARWRVPYGVVVQNLTGPAVVASGVG
jgi:colanic acid biosynthesis glycosyl transferase WcaI